MYLWILAAVAAYFIKGLCGFANTLVFTSILSFGVANANISPIDLLLGYPTNLILTWKNRKRLVPKVYLPLAALVLAECFPRQLIDIFGAANESVYYTEFAVKAFRTYLCMMPLACVNKACFIFLQAVGKALASTLLSMFREVVFGVGFALLLPVFFGLDGVLYSMPVSDILTFLISAVIIVKTYRELNAEPPKTPESQASA